MKTSLNLILAFTLVCSAHLSAQSDLSGIPEEYHEVITRGANGGCAFFDAEIIVTQPTCNGSNDGQVCIDTDSITGGVGPFELLWFGEFSGDPTAECLDGLAAGSFTCIVTDIGQGSVLCSFQASVIEPFPIVVLAWNEVAPSCFGICDGQASPVVGGGAGGFSFNFNSGENTLPATMLCNPFELTITDADGCTADTVFFFEDAAEEIIADSVIVNTCFGESTGSINLNVSGGNPIPINGYTYSWSSTNTDFVNTNTQDISGLGAGIYTVIITDNSPCSIIKNYTVEESPEIETSPQIMELLCYGENDASITLNVSGGINPFTYEWTGNGVNPTSEDQIGLPSGDFEVIITDSIGCQIDETFTIAEPDSISITGVVVDVSCFGEADGIIALDITGGNPPYTNFNWETPACYIGPTNQQDISGLCAGIYEFTVSDQDGCSISATFEIAEPEQINLELTKTDISCFGENDGQIDLIITGGAQPPNIPSWEPLPFTVDGNGIRDLGPGTYNVEYEDDNGCIATSSITILEDNEITVTETIDDASCSNELDGSITISIVGGVEPYNIILWQNEVGDDVGNLTTLNDIGFGDYTLTVIDANGCIFSDTYTVDAPEEVAISIEDVSPISCFEGDDGAIDIGVTGGNGIYNYNWTGTPNNPSPSNTQDLNNLQSGTYTVVVSSLSCAATEIITIEPANQIELTFDITPISCPNIDDAEIDMNIIGGALPLQSITWAGPACFPGSNNEDIAGLCPGTYFVLVFDANGCEISGSVEIEPPPELEITAEITDNSCYNGMTGAIDITLSDESGSPTFNWNGPGIVDVGTEDISGLAAGDYEVIVTLNGCITEDNFAVAENDSIYVDEIISPFPCNGTTQGSIDITPHGGIGPYTYFWTGPGIDGTNNTDEDQLSLGAGDFLLVVTDSLSCFIQKEYSLEASANVNINGIVTDLSCFEANDGSISTNPSGGSVPYSFSWTGPNLFSNLVDQNISPLFPGDYNLTVVDDNGCIVDTLMTVLEPPEIIITVTTTDPTCGNNNGTMTISTVGGVGITIPSVTDSNGDPVVDLNNLGAGVYTVTAVDGNSCSETETVTLSNSEIELIGIVEDIACFGDNNGSISITITGAIGTPVISWTGDGPIDDPDGPIISNLIAGEYVVTVTDDNGCIASEIFNVMENDEILASVAITGVFCESDNNGQITVTETIGGSGGYSYFWNSGLHTDFESITIDNLVPGIYELTVIDAEMCSSNFSFEIEAAIGLELTATITDVVCFGDSTGAIDLSVIGGAPPYDFAWTGGSETQNLTNVPTGQYLVTVTDDNGCSKDSLFTVGTNTSIFGSAELTNVSCFNDTTGSITLIDLGGAGPHDFNWSSTGFSSSNQDIIDLSADTYLLNIRDALDCEIDTFFTITEPTPIGFTANVNNVVCFGDSTGSIIIDEIIGGIGDYIVSWSPMPDGSNVVDGNLIDIPAGDYELSVQDENNCIESGIFTVLNINTPIIATANVSSVFCAGQNDGCINVEVEGGIPDYSYNWIGAGIDDPTLQNQCDLAPGDYTLEITDNLTCTVDTFFTVTETNPLDLQLVSITQNFCSGDGVGAIDIQVQGGSPQYIFEWTGDNGFFEITEDINGLDGGVYNIHVVDFNNCEIDQQFTIEEPGNIDYNLDLTNSNCGIDDGQAEVNGVIGGVVANDYSINWFNAMLLPIGTGSNITDLAPGIYSLEIIDDNTCTAGETFTISDNTGSISSLTTPISCFNEDDGSIAVTVEGFTRPITFVWNDSNGIVGMDSVITDLDADTYIITVTDALDCQIVESFDLENPEIITANAIITHETCPGAEDGTINLSVEGGSGNYTYAWTGLGILFPQNQDQSNLPPGNYSVTITDDNTCFVIIDFTIDSASEFTIEETINPITCFDINDASIVVDIDFGTFPPIADLSFDWSGPDVTTGVQNQFNLGPGEYSLTVTTPNACIAQETYTISPVTEITIDVTTTNSTCLMDNGSAMVNALGGNVVLDYGYSWLEGNGSSIMDSDNLLENVGAGLYQINVSDDNGCIVSQDFVISDEGGILTYEVDSVSCPGLSDGAIDITYSGMTEPVGIIWSGPPGNYNPQDEDISGLQIGEYTVLITGTDGCVLGDVIPVFENDFVSSTAVVTDISCFELEDGSIDITATGGNSPYSFSWMGPDGPVTPDANGDLSDLPAGEYSVTITDNELCTGTATYTIAEPDDISLIATVDAATCFGDNDGQITIVNVSGGISPYEFDWTLTDDPTFSNNFQNIDELVAGTYNLTLADFNDCQYTESFDVEVNSEINISVTPSNANCGLPTGGASVSASGGTDNFTYEWYDGDFLLDEDSPVISNLVQGSYSVTVIDENGCSASEDFSIQNDDYSVFADISNVDCFGANSGAIEITLSDDFTLPISVIQWTGPVSEGPPPPNLTITDLIAGTYTLSLADANGCPFEDDYVVEQPDSISIASIEGNVLCFGDETGSIVLSPTGGTPFETLTPAYSFDWVVPSDVSNPGNIHFAEDIPFGTYTITVTDSLNCTNDIEIEISQPDEIELFAIVQSPVCESDLDGSIELVVTGGTDDFTYLWDNEAVVNEIDNLAIGDYSVTIEDTNECILDSTFTITASIILDLQYEQENISCFSFEDGSIDLDATGGSEDYIYNWNSSMDPNVINNPNEDLTDLVGGEYYLQLTDNINGCIKNDTIIITVPDSLYAVSESISPLCFGENNGEVLIDPLGGTTPYEFTWSSDDPGFSENSEDIMDLVAGEYQLEILDSNSCVRIYNFELIEPPALNLSIDDVTNAFCYTSEDGSIETTASGGSPAYDITWTSDGGAEFTGEDINNLLPGEYYLNLLDTNQCALQDTVVLNYDQEIFAVIDNQDPECEQSIVNLDGTQSIGATSYVWQDVNDQVISDVEVASVTLTDGYDSFILEVSNGVCAHTDTLDLIVNPIPLVDAGMDQDAFPDEEIEIGGNPSSPTAISYLWQPGELLSDSTNANPTYLNIGTQVFVLTVTDANFCVNKDSILINLVNEVIIPDGFSPNSDGVNDTWIITNSDKFPDILVKIYNRWGDKLFESSGYNTPWDGIYNGQEVPVGTYYYAIELKDPLFPKPFTGPLTIFK